MCRLKNTIMHILLKSLVCNCYLMNLFFNSVRFWKLVLPLQLLFILFLHFFGRNYAKIRYRLLQASTRDEEPSHFRCFQYFIGQTLSNEGDSFEPRTSLQAINQDVWNTKTLTFLPSLLMRGKASCLETMSHISGLKEIWKEMSLGWRIVCICAEKSILSFLFAWSY